MLIHDGILFEATEGVQVEHAREIMRAGVTRAKALRSGLMSIRCSKVVPATATSPRWKWLAQSKAPAAAEKSGRAVNTGQGTVRAQIDALSRTAALDRRRWAEWTSSPCAYRLMGLTP